MSNKISLTLFCLASAALTLFWVMVIPPFETPDEQAHLSTITYLSQEGRLPWGNDRDTTAEMIQAQKILGTFRNILGQNRYTYHPEYQPPYSDKLFAPEENNILSANTPDLRASYVATEAAHYPPLYYYLQRYAYESVAGSDLLTRLFVVRLFGVILAGLTACVGYHIGQLLFGKTSLAYLTALFVTALPMSTFLMAGVNSDNLHNFLFTTLIYFCLRLIQSGPSVLTLTALMSVLVLDIYTKPQGFVGITLVVMALLIYTLKAKNYKLLLLGFALVLLAILLGEKQLRLYVGLLETPNLTGANLVEYLKYSLNQLTAQHSVWYWGVFKWLGVVLPPIYWQLANRLVLLSLVGLGYYLYLLRRRTRNLPSSYLALFLFVTSLIYAVSIYWYDYQHHKTLGYSLGIQARYFYPTAVAHLTLFIVGITTLGRLKSWLSRIVNLLLPLFIIWMQLGGIWRLITSYYDTTSLTTFITQASQYKPWFAKGEWWYLWITLYILSLSYLTWTLVLRHPVPSAPSLVESAGYSLKPQKYERKKRKDSI